MPVRSRTFASAGGHSEMAITKLSKSFILGSNPSAPARDFHVIRPKEQGKVVVEKILKKW